MPRLAIGPQFPRELSALATPVRRDVVVALRRFLTNASGGPHAERVRGGRDPRVATLRLTEGFRAVVVRQRDVYWAVTVLPGPEAWSYAQRHRYTVNPVIGVVEEWDAESLERVEPALRRSAGASRLFDPICDGDLLALGIDVRALPLVRHITTEADVEALEPLLPPTQHRPLAVLARDGSLSEAWRELDACRAVDAPPGPVNPDDLHAALQRSPNLAVFTANREELDRVLSAPDWCTFLHPAQHRLARAARYDFPVLVTGGAGTGKTLVALHRAAWLAERGAGPVLLVTLTQSLSNDLSAKLDTMIADEVARKRVEVGNVDRLAMRIVADTEGRQPALIGPGGRTLPELTAEALRLLSRETGDLLDDIGPGHKPYRHIVVDEGQDVSPAQWRLLRAAVQREHNDLFIVGDPHQRVTDTRIALGAVGIPAEQHTLMTSYRLPHEILSFGVRLRGGGPANGLVKGFWELHGLRAARHGERPMIRAYDTQESELSGLVQTVGWWLEDGVPAAQVAVAARTQALVRAARKALGAAGHEVLAATFHGLKGLEFERVALFGVTEGVVPETPQEDAAGPGERAHALQRERSILYVACTRARSLLYISHTGRASPFLYV